MLYHVQVKTLSRTRVEITLAPTWLGRLFRRRMRQGIAERAEAKKGRDHWWWLATDRYVGDYIEQYIEAAPMLTIEDMTVEQLLLEDPRSPLDRSADRSAVRSSKKKTTAS